jgi:hypothetical protein
LREIHTPVAHVAAVSTPPAEQLVAPDTPYPALHAGWHVAPSARVLVHVPRPPLVGAVTPVHGVYVGVAVGVAVVGAEDGAYVGVAVGATAVPEIFSKALISGTPCVDAAPE